MSRETPEIREALATYETESPETESVPLGYRQTEVGVIPEDWDVRSLGDVSEIKTGEKNNEDRIEDGQYPFFVRSQTVERIDTFSHDGEAILVPGEGLIGNIFHYINGKFDYHQRVYKISDFAQDVDAKYVYYYIVHNFHKQATRNSVKATVDSLRLPTFTEFQVAAPPLREQRAIAAALSDVDGLISALDRLISKKRALKTAAMQRLLTGEQRLPGFSGEWETRRLGDVAAIKTGEKNNQDKIEDGQYPFFVRSQHVERIDSYSFDGEAILVPGEGGIGSVFHYIYGKFDYHQRVYKISDFHADICGKFVYYCMVNNFDKQAMSNSVKATVDSLRW